MLAIFDTHPIQYRSPVFRALAEMHPGLRVYFFEPGFDGGKFWFHEVGTAKSSDFGLSLASGFPSEILGCGRKTWWGKWRAIRQVLERDQPTAVLIYGYYLPEHWILRWLCARRGIALFFVGETFTESRSGWRQLVKRLPLKWFFGGVHTFIAIGKKTREFYEAQGIASDRIRDARYCVDNHFFQMDPVERAHLRETWRQRLGIPQDGIVVLTVGRLFSRKRPWDAIELQRRLPLNLRVSLVMVGGGPMEAELRAAALGIPRVTLLGFQDQVQTRAAYAGSDLFFLPSEYETWGLVINEAMVSGLPAVVTETCGAANDLVIDGENGYVFSVGDLAKAASKIEILARERELRKRMAREAVSHAVKSYTAEGFATTVLKAWEGVEGEKAISGSGIRNRQSVRRDPRSDRAVTR